ncbi:MAG TPA: metal-dependent hydrolase [Polyangia bacterium]|nr:metal-dependent hydrolase [Polyangia bacterium]
MAFASKRPAPAVSLATAILAAQWLDTLWPIFLLLGIEHVRIDPGNTRLTPLDFFDYPWTHSALMAVVWGVVFGATHFAFRRSARAAFVLGALVPSHWVLDFLTHRPDLPLWPGGPRVGLGLWNAPVAEAVLEAAIYVAGLAVYLRATRPRDRRGRLGAWAFAVFIPLLHVITALSPPPPSVGALAWSAAILPWPLLLWARWVDRHRQPR